MTEERKLVTVLFADIVGSTAATAEEDPEVVRNTLSRYLLPYAKGWHDRVEALIRECEAAAVT